MNEVVATIPPSESFLTVGHPLKLSLSMGEGKRLYGSTLLGWKDHAWLVCEWPVQLPPGAALIRAMPCTVSYLHGGKLVGYRSEIRDAVRVPVPLVFLAFPQAVEEMHLRKHVRVPSAEPALLIRAESAGASTWSSSEYVGGIVEDLSLGGCSIAVGSRPAWLRPGSVLRMEFELPGIGHVTNLSGVVKNTEVRDGADTIGVAFQFDGLEYIEYRGWGGSVQQAIERCILQKHGAAERP